MRAIACVLLGACTVPEHAFTFEVALNNSVDVASVSVDDDLAQVEYRPASILVTRASGSYTEARARGLLTLVIAFEDGSIVTSATRVEACLEECLHCGPLDELTREAIQFGPPFEFGPGDRSCFFCDRADSLTAVCP